MAVGSNLHSNPRNQLWMSDVLRHQEAGAGCGNHSIQSAFFGLLCIHFRIIFGWNVTFLYFGILIVIAAVIFTVFRCPMYEAILAAFMILTIIAGEITHIFAYIPGAANTYLLYSIAAFICFSIFFEKIGIIGDIINIIIALVGRFSGGASRLRRMILSLRSASRPEHLCMRTSMEPIWKSMRSFQETGSAVLPARSAMPMRLRGIRKTTKTASFYFIPPFGSGVFLPGRW